MRGLLVRVAARLGGLGGDTTEMSLVVAVLLVGLLLGRLGGGSLDSLGGVPLRSRRLVVGALLAQAGGAVVGGPAYALGLVLSAGLVTAFLVRNRGVRGTGLVALGLLANALVVAANGAMPVSEHAAGRAGVSTAPLLTGEDRRHEPADSSTRLPWLGDVVPVPLPLRPEVVSPGDVLVAAGLAQLVVVGMLQHRHDRRHRQQRAARGHAQGRPRPALPPLPDRPAPGPAATAPAAAPPGARSRRRPPPRLPASERLS